MGLFQQPATTPPWLDLPAEVRLRTLVLLARLLRGHRHGLRGGRQRREVGDE
jgi:hypothetical protein